jgi:hypothetical protein
MLGAADGSGDSATARSWAVLVGSQVLTLRTIPGAATGGTPVCMIGKSPRDKINAALVVAPNAHATDTTKIGARSRRTAAHPEWDFLFNRIADLGQPGTKRSKEIRAEPSTAAPLLGLVARLDPRPITATVG